MYWAADSELQEFQFPDSQDCRGTENDHEITGSLLMISESVNLDSLDKSEELAVMLGEQLQRNNQRITTAESCTGGLIAAAITEVAGSSGWFEQGAVTYSNNAKQAMLDVEPMIFEQFGAVSEECVQSMAKGALQRSGADVAISVSGIAGPGGATPGKPVGTVWIAWAIRHLLPESSDDVRAVIENNKQARPLQSFAGKVESEVFQFAGDRKSVRRQALCQALRGTLLRIC